MLLEILKHIVSQPDGHLILLGVARRVIANTPTWVYALFIALVGFGLSQTRKRTISERALFLAPIGMAGFSLYSVIGVFGSAAAASIWAAGAAVALGIGFALKRPEGVRYEAQARRFEISGSWIPFALIMAVFLVRYLLAAAMGIDPSLRHAAGFMIAASLVYGLLGGLFPARAVRFYRARVLD
jgi:hypothetical protein